MRHFLFPLPHYITYLLISIVGSLSAGGYIAYRQNVPTDYTTWLWSFFAIIFALCMMGFVVIKLPIFRKFYQRDILNINHRQHNAMREAESKVAAALASLLVGVIIYMTLYLFGVSQPLIASACGFITAGTMSFYYAYQ
jgi:cytochrome bd-type quinol oxidase subunit 2